MEEGREAGGEEAWSCPFELKWGGRSEHRGEQMMALEA